MKLSIIIPAYNEADRLPKTLADIESFFEERKTAIELHEIIVVDDGSADATCPVILAWQERMPMKCIQLPVNQGKGAALRAGVREAKGEFVLLYDADAATPIDEVLRLYREIERQHADIAIGSRVLHDAHAKVRMALHRKMIGRIYHFLTVPLIGNIQDAACGCKLFPRVLAQEIFAQQTINRFAYDIEILALARERGLRIAEVPVTWNAVPESKVRIFRDGIEMFSRVLSLYVRRWHRR